MCAVLCTGAELEKSRHLLARTLKYLGYIRPQGGETNHNPLRFCTYWPQPGNPTTSQGPPRATRELGILQTWSPEIRWLQPADFLESVWGHLTMPVPEILEANPHILPDCSLLVSPETFSFHFLCFYKWKEKP